MIKRVALAMTVLLGMLAAPFCVAGGVNVVASIKPVHALVAGVMQGVAEPKLLLQGGASPHDFSLRPADARAIYEADLVFWVGEQLESFLTRMLPSTKARNVALAQAPGVELLALREGGLWDEDGHQPDHQPDHQHRTGDYDPHIWLDPHNAVAMVRAIRAALMELDPSHRDRYRANAAALIVRLQALDAALAERLASIKGKPYIVFHDGYQYFERRYGLAAVGAVTLNPEKKTGARRVSEIRRRINENRIVCVFSEPQFKPALVQVLIENTSVRTGVLDPLGGTLPAGPDSYFQLMNKLADNLHACLA